MRSKKVKNFRIFIFVSCKLDWKEDGIQGEDSSNREVNRVSDQISDCKGEQTILAKQKGQQKEEEEESTGW